MTKWVIDLTLEIDVNDILKDIILPSKMSNWKNITIKEVED